MRTKIACLTLVLLSGCGAMALDPSAEKVERLKDLPKGCQFIGDVVGGQGNLVTAGVTLDEKLVEGARNDIRNKAAEKGANVVVMDMNNNSNRGLLAGGGVHSSVVAGGAWLCIGRPARLFR
jgi:hypothetical protein